MKKYFIRGYSIAWGPGHWFKFCYGPMLEEDELKRLGATLELRSHRPCVFEQDESPRWDIAVYSVDVPPEQNTLPLPEPIKVGYEGYIVDLNDPWDASPADHYCKDYELLVEEPLEVKNLDDFRKECTCQECRQAVENM